MRYRLLALCLGSLLPCAGLLGATITVNVDRPGAAINPAMWGLFFEDINFGADGGLYAELVKNRGFEFPEPLMGWTAIHPTRAKGTLTVRTDKPFNAKNAHYVRVQSEGSGLFGLSNEGFRGIGVHAREPYDFAVRVRRVEGTPKLVVRLYSSDGALLASADFTDLPADWQKRTAELRSNETDPKASLLVLVEGKGTVDLDFVSLFPRNTWKNRPGGLRADMVQALADMKPGFLRFPGGCIVEGVTLDNRYQWKNTLGPVEERQLLQNRWNTEFIHRATPDYFQSFGLGFFEYFQLCEDIGAQPLPILNCGMACQYNTGELCPPDELDRYIQDALDLIEFANGPVTTPWGAKRAELGHPAPFNLKLLGVGNEQWGPQYIERYARFAAVLKARYPEIALVASAGPRPDDARFKFLWEKLRALPTDLIDEHSYNSPQWFLDNAHRYDNYDRHGPAVFMGEYASHTVGAPSPKKRNDLEGAIAEAAFLTGLERNADVVRMASYAPLFAHQDAWQWAPDLLWVDNLRTLRTPNYHVQRLFATNRGDRVLPVALTVADPAETKRLYASATLDDSAGEAILKLVNATAANASVTIELTGSGPLRPGTLTTLQGDSLDAMNRFDAPERVTPHTTAFTPASARFTLNLPANSLTVVRVGVAH